MADCTEPVRLHAYLRNLGAAILPSGVEVGFYVRDNGVDTLLGTATSQTALFPGQVAEIILDVDPGSGVDTTDVFVAKIEIDPQNPTFHECREDNNESNEAHAICVM